MIRVVVKTAVALINQKVTLLLFLISVISTGPVLSQSTGNEDFLPMEVSGGLGYAYSFDQNLFNNSVPYKIKGGVGYNAAFRYYLNYNVSVGLRLSGMFEIISDYPEDEIGYFIDENLILSTVNVGFEGRYIYELNRYQPFLGFGIQYAYGDLSFEEAGYINHFHGFSLGGSAGMGYLIRNDIMISLEASAQSGRAKWQFDPGVSSFNRKFNPGTFMVILSASYFFAY